jgi:hypothetical protein
MFASIALVLSVVGIYGVVTHVVGQRTREFGVCLASVRPLARSFATFSGMVCVSRSPAASFEWPVRSPSLDCCVSCCTESAPLTQARNIFLFLRTRLALDPAKMTLSY